MRKCRAWFQGIGIDRLSCAAGTRCREARAPNLLVALLGALVIGPLAAQPTPSADLQVEFADPPVFVEIGQVAEIAVRVRNAGPAAAATSRVYIAYPIFLNGASVVAPAGWQCTPPSPPPPIIPPPMWSYECTTPVFQPGAVDFLFRLPTPFQLGYRFNVEVSATSATADPVTFNNRAAIRIIAGAPLDSDLAISVEGPRVPVRSGEELRWLLTVTNSGPAAAQGFELYWSEIPAQPFAVLAPMGWNCPRTVLQGGFVAVYRCTTALMAPASTASFSVSRRVPRSEGARQNFGAHFSVMAPADRIEANNLDEANAWIAGGGPGSTELAVNVLPSQSPGVFDVVVSNHGPSVAAQTMVSFNVPKTGDPPLVTAPGWTCRILEPRFYPPSVDRWDFGCYREQLLVGEHALQVTVVPSATPDLMRVHLTSAANEANLDDNVVDVALGPAGFGGVPVPVLLPFGLLVLIAGFAGSALLQKRSRAKVC